jgi:hypothetical protein
LLFRFLLLAYKDKAISQLDLPSGNRAHCGSLQRLTGSQAEAGVMPRTAHRVIDEETFRERPAIMRTGGADREDLIAPAGEQHGLLADVSQEHSAIGKFID